MTKDQADELLEKQKEGIQDEASALEDELNGIQNTLATLKKQLYGRFGSNINLEES